MLRSRGNRQQRPSESSDEQHGRSGYYGGGNNGSSSSSYNNNNSNSYGGYPASQSPMAGISSGNDDDNYDPYGKKPKQSRGMFGFGSSSGGQAIKKAPSSGGGYTGYGAPSSSSTTNRNVWDKKSIGSTIKGNPKHSSSSSSTITMIFSIALIVTLALGGATLHYRKAISRIEHELRVVERKMKRFNGNHRFNDNNNELNAENFEEELQQQGQEEEEDDDNEEDGEASNDNSSNTSEEEISNLARNLADLNIEKKKWESRLGSLNHDISALQAQYNHLSNKEIPSYESRISGMETALARQEQMTLSHKDQFINSHKKKNANEDGTIDSSYKSSGGIVPGGPGHAIIQQRALESMESLDDYENYVEEREDALWDKIDILVAKLERESRREAIEWYVYSLVVVIVFVCTYHTMRMVACNVWVVGYV